MRSIKIVMVVTLKNPRGSIDPIWARSECCCIFVIDYYIVGLSRALFFFLVHILYLAWVYLLPQTQLYTLCPGHGLVRIHSKGYCNHLVCQLVCVHVMCASVCTSYFSLVSGFITWYFRQLGLARHKIDANKNGFLRIHFVVDKKGGKNFGSLICLHQGCHLLTEASYSLSNFELCLCDYFSTDRLQNTRSFLLARILKKNFLA